MTAPYNPAPYSGQNYGYPATAPKSKTAAALFAFFLGAIGVHDFYLGKKTLGIIHVVLAVIAFALVIAGFVYVGAHATGPNGEVPSDELGPVALFLGLGYGIGIINALWSFVEFILILVRKDPNLV
ncbi:TM2 domain-containing protein [Actinomyces vulturis]|uniref:TM2 domain-containing protein n=1 Tax=Actinomyces vulturis TaxID=1857645 RepID=UPI000832A259|nr:TM2 domain-containing protein [Actinomyces vulturis]